ERDLGVARAAGRKPGANRAEVGDVVAADSAGRDRSGQLTAMARLLPFVAEKLPVVADADDRRDLRLGLSRAVRAQKVEVPAGGKRFGAHDRLVARGDRADDVAG